MTSERTHTCPGGCGAQVPYDKLACPLDWARLPQVYKNKVLQAWRRRSSDPTGHIRAVAEASAWYRRNPHRSFTPRPQTSTSPWPAARNRHDTLYSKHHSHKEGGMQ